MVKLDPSLIRFFDDEDFRVLTALEMATKNHEVAPTVLIERIAQLSHGGCRKRLKYLLKHKIITHHGMSYDGYAMKYHAFDFLALRTLAKRGSVAGVGTRIGCGKESDIFLIEDDHGQEAVLKLQRLGRTSFRSVARNRDYKNGKERRGASWFYLSRLAATKEFAFMKMLYDEGFPVPKPIDHNRHGVVMEYVKGTLLNHITVMEKKDAQKVYQRCVNLVVKLAQHGLIHGDFNEFNCFVTDSLHIVMIDFPQIVSTDHKNAEDLFNRDVKNLANFFERRFKVDELLWPSLTKDVERVGELDKVVMASGFSRKDEEEMNALMGEIETGGNDIDDEEEEEEGEEFDSEEEDGEEQQQENDDGEEAPELEKVGDITSIKRAAKIQGGEQNDVAELDEEAQEELVKAAVSKKGAKPIPGRGTKAPAADEDSDEDEEEEGDNDSEDERQVERRKERGTVPVKQNPNFKNGKLDLQHIKNRVKAKAQFNENRQFNQTMSRNMTKGRDKQSIKRKMGKVKDGYSADDY